MNLNNLIFSIPNPTYSSTSLNGLIWIPRTRLFSMKSILKDLTLEGDSKEPKAPFENSSKCSSWFGETHNLLEIFQIPCLYQKYKQDCKDVILYFHGNAEDLGMCESFGKNLSLLLKVKTLLKSKPYFV